MKNKILSFMRLALTLSRLEKRRPSAGEPFSTEGFVFPPMKPLQPPAAQNDDVMLPIYEAVKRDLSAAGYLR